MHATIKISDLKSTEDGKTKPATSTRHYLNIQKTLRRLDARRKPRNRAEQRTRRLYESIKVRGYHPGRGNWRHPQAYQQGGNVILWSGHHRIAILDHLGHTHATVQIQERQYLRRGYW
jgi:hypothetical protein